MLTTEALVAEIPEEKKEAAMPGGPAAAAWEACTEPEGKEVRSKRRRVGNKEARGFGRFPGPLFRGTGARPRRTQRSVNAIAIVTSTATGSPCRVPGTKRHWRAALMAS